MTRNETIGTAIAAVVLTIDLVTDYRLRLKYRNVVKPEGSVNHKRGLWLRAIALAPAVFFSWYKMSGLILFGYWHLFDGLTNVLWKNNWFRIGTTSATDKFMRRYPWVLWFKYIGLAVSILLYVFKDKINFVS